MKTLVRVDKLSGGYHKTVVIKDISFDIKKGDFLGIIGPSLAAKHIPINRASAHALNSFGVCQ